MAEWMLNNNLIWVVLFSIVGVIFVATLVRVWKNTIAWNKAKYYQTNKSFKACKIKKNIYATNR